jgi:hypothetical protein
VAACGSAPRRAEQRPERRALGGDPAGNRHAEAEAFVEGQCRLSRALEIAGQAIAIGALDADPKERRPETAALPFRLDEEPTVSPDGRWLAYCWSSGGSSL